MMMLRVTPQRTALTRRVAPTPMIHAVMAWVVETGNPQWAANCRTVVPEVWAENPSAAVRWTIREPTVRMIRLPPAKVPSPMTMAQASLTQVGTAGVLISRSVKSAKVMMPMVFWASFNPCERAMPLADNSCSDRKLRLTRPGCA